MAIATIIESGFKQSQQQQHTLPRIPSGAIITHPDGSSAGTTVTGTIAGMMAVGPTYFPPLPPPPPPASAATREKQRWAAAHQDMMVDIVSNSDMDGGEEGESELSVRSDSSTQNSDLEYVERTLKSLNGYHERILELLQASACNNANERSGSGSGASGSAGGHHHQQSSHHHHHHHQGSSCPHTPHSGSSNMLSVPGSTLSTNTSASEETEDNNSTIPIKIRNLEDLLRQLESS